MASSSEKSFLNFPGIFCENNNKKKKHFCVSVSSLSIINIVKKWHPYLPRLTQAADGCSVQTHNNSKKTAEVLLSFTAVK